MWQFPEEISTNLENLRFSETRDNFCKEIITKLELFYNSDTRWNCVAILVNTADFCEVDGDIWFVESVINCF